MNELLFTKMNYGLYLIATRQGGDMDGCLTNTVSQITYEPHRISFSLDKQERTHNLLMESKKAVISILSEQADDMLLQHFGKNEASAKPKFRTDCNDYPYSLTVDGIPYLQKQASAYLCCQLISTTDFGTHTLFLAECTDGDILREDAPYLFRHTKETLHFLKTLYSPKLPKADPFQP